MYNIPTDVVDEVFRLLRPFRVPSLPAPETVRVKQALHACTLVSRSWRALAQPHLFDNVYYSFMDLREDIAPLRMVETEARWGRHELSIRRQWLPLKTFSGLYHFLQESPALARCIHRLSAAAVSPDLSHMGVVRTTGAVPLSLFIGLVQLLPSLRKLSLSDFKLDIPHGHQFTPLSSHSLVELEIFSSNTRLDRAMLAGVLGCFSAIGKLGIHLYIFDQSDSPSDVALANSITPSGPATVQHLVIAVMTDPRKYVWVLSKFLDLKHVATIDIFPSWRLWMHQSLVDAMSPSLREAKVTARPYDDIGLPGLTVSFASCHELQRLTINTSLSSLLELQGSQGTPEHAALCRASLEVQLEPATRLLSAAEFQRAEFRHFSELRFNLDIGLSHHHGDRAEGAPWIISDIPCEGAAGQLDRILCDIARRTPSRKITFVWLGPECWPGDLESGVRSCGCTGEDKEFVVGADVFLGRLFPWLCDHGMITSIGPSRVMIGP